MVGLTPNDIANKKFRQSFRGYATSEVDDFLQEIVDSFYEVLKDNDQLKVQNADASEKLRHFQTNENLIKDAIVLAKSTADETRNNAQRESELIRREAEEWTRKLRLDTEADLHGLLVEVEGLKQERLRLIAEVRAVLFAQLSFLETQEKHLSGATQNKEGENL
jgi:cell division initiation protein